MVQERVVVLSVLSQHVSGGGDQVELLQVSVAVCLVGSLHVSGGGGGREGFGLLHDMVVVWSVPSSLDSTGRG